jgi:hypothetical protein
MRDVWFYALFIAIALAMLFGNVDPGPALEQLGLNHFLVGAVVVGLGAAGIWRGFGGKHSGKMAALGMIFLGGVAYYMFVVRGW